MLSDWEVACYLFKRGFFDFLRGFTSRFRFKSCGKKFFLGKNCRIYFPKFLEIGDNVVIAAHSILNGLSEKGIRIGNNVHVREYAWIQATSRLDTPGIGVSIGDHTYIGPHSYFGAGGGIEIGKNVLIGGYVHLLAENHRYDHPEKTISEQGVTRKGIIIGDNVWIGNNVVVLDGITIGKNCVIGAGSVVTKSVPENSIAVGNPARVLRSRGDAAS